MKKRLMLFLAFLLALSLCAGCGSLSDVADRAKDRRTQAEDDDDDDGDDEETDEDEETEEATRRGSRRSRESTEEDASTDPADEPASASEDGEKGGKETDDGGKEKDMESYEAATEFWSETGLRYADVWMGEQDSVIVLYPDMTFFYWEPYNTGNPVLNGGVYGMWSVENGQVLLPDVGRYHLYAAEDTTVLTFYAQEEGWTVEAFTRGRLGADVDFSIMQRLSDIDMAMAFGHADEARTLLDDLGYLTGNCNLINDRRMALDHFNDRTWGLYTAAGGALQENALFHLDGTFDLQGGIKRHWTITRGYLTLEGFEAHLFHYNPSEQCFLTSDVLTSGSTQYRWSIRPIQ